MSDPFLEMTRRDLRTRPSNAEVFIHWADDGSPCVGIGGASPDEKRELEGLCLQLEPRLRNLGADIPTKGATAAGRVLLWVGNTLHNVPGTLDFSELPDQPFRAIALAIDKLLAESSPPAAPEEELLPDFLGAADLAKHLDEANPGRVESSLRRYRGKYPDCFRQVEGGRRNEPKYLYRVADVLPHLKQALAKG